MRSAGYIEVDNFSPSPLRERAGVRV